MPKTARICPQCMELRVFNTKRAADLAMAAGGCQGCRAQKTLTENPGLILTFMDFWSRTGWPESNAWKAAVPAKYLTAYNQLDEITAGGMLETEFLALLGGSDARYH